MKVAVVLIFSLISVASSTPWLRISDTKEVVVLPKVQMFTSAVETCENLGGELLSLTIEQFKTLLNKIIDQLFTTDATEIWLGRVKLNSRTKMYTFEDGTPLPLANLTTLAFEERTDRMCLGYRLSKVSDLKDFEAESCSSSKTVICQRHPDRWSVSMAIAISALVLSSVQIVVTATCLILWCRHKSSSSSKFRTNGGKKIRNSSESGIEAKEMVKVDPAMP